MPQFLKQTAIILCLLCGAFAFGVPASADSFSIGVNSHQGRGNTVSVGFGDIAFAYRDGYWDNSHRWHRWRNAREHRNYRHRYSNGYSNWNHDRDGDDGWRRDNRDDRRDRRREHR